jgi:hypothetical protein
MSAGEKAILFMVVSSNYYSTGRLKNKQWGKRWKLPLIDRAESI